MFMNPLVPRCRIETCNSKFMMFSFYCVYSVRRHSAAYFLFSPAVENIKKKRGEKSCKIKMNPFHAADEEISI